MIWERPMGAESGHVGRRHRPAPYDRVSPRLPLQLALRPATFLSVSCMHKSFDDSSEPHRTRDDAAKADERRFTSWFPGLVVLRAYNLSWLRYDLTAGLVMTAMLVPVGIAYAQASGLPGITGLYATIVPLLAYAVFGPSRILILGPDSALAAVILGVVLPHSAGDPESAIRIGSLMAIVSGLVCIAAGLAKLGFITELLSKPIRYGYMNGIALTVLLSQIPKLGGFSVKAEGPLRQVWGIAQQILAGKVNLVAFGIGAGTLILILLLKRWLRVPGILLAVVVATLLVAVFDLDKRAGVSVLGVLPR